MCVHVVGCRRGGALQGGEGDSSQRGTIWTNLYDRALEEHWSAQRFLWPFLFREKEMAPKNSTIAILEKLCINPDDIHPFAAQVDSSSGSGPAALIFQTKVPSSSASGGLGRHPLNFHDARLLTLDIHTNGRLRAIGWDCCGIRGRCALIGRGLHGSGIGRCLITCAGDCGARVGWGGRILIRRGCDGGRVACREHQESADACRKEKKLFHGNRGRG